ncbi:hypothetical protein [uncultured Aquimarina sp.]|uniref:hypothetical protein n=1 Tax=uncultured Aquimarina sp. TaxID=575652 RepID=UPI0026142B1C|nr:hypothetical protein [uncultured Aquimarina sp.]
MKNNFLNIEGIQVLNKSIQKQINGGQSFDCHCGLIGSSGESHAHIFPAKSINDALSQLADICGGQGGTCSGLG